MNVDFAKEQYDMQEINAVLDVLNTGWLASGKHNTLFEEEFAKYVGTKYAVCCNSGSSANLLALACLRLPPGSRVLTSGCGFPQTLAPILRLGFEPFMVDYDIRTHNIDTAQCYQALTEVDAIIFAHTMGNPVDPELIRTAKEAGVFVIEDCCEAVGAEVEGSKVGSLGDLGTFSFYPAHQITAGGMGGMVVTNDEKLAFKMKSLRDWGKRWDWAVQLGDVKTAFQEKVDGIPYYRGYTYDTIGFNFKLAEMNAAFGREQLKRVDSIVDRRMKNHNFLGMCMRDLNLFEEVQVIPGARPSWFGYTMTLKEEYHGKRDHLVDYLESNGVRTRPFFAGNITRHKPFIGYKQDLPTADRLMEDSFFVGCWQGLNETHFMYIKDRIKQWMKFM